MAKGSNMASPDRYQPAEERKSGWDDYEVRSALETLARADKIRKNKPLMAAVKAEAKRQLQAAQATHSNLQGGK